MHSLTALWTGYITYSGTAYNKIAPHLREQGKPWREHLLLDQFKSFTMHIVYNPQQQFCMHLNKGTSRKKYFRTHLVLLQAQWNK